MVRNAAAECLNETWPQDLEISNENVLNQIEKIKGQWVVAKCYELTALRLKQLDVNWSDILDAVAGCYNKIGITAICKMIKGGKSKNEEKAKPKSKIKEKLDTFYRKTSSKIIF